MTTICYKDGVVAYDSRQTMGEVIVNDNHEKKIESNGVKFVCCGASPDFEALINWFHNGEEVRNAGSMSALAVAGSEIYYCGYNKQDGAWKLLVEKDVPRALGSGQDHAWTAMDMGATAKEAVKWAMKRDTGTGGRIRTFKVK